MNLSHLVDLSSKDSLQVGRHEVQVHHFRPQAGAHPRGVLVCAAGVREASGLGYDVQTRWPSYFAWRLAPPGEAGPLLAASVCCSFSPGMVAAHVPRSGR